MKQIKKLHQSITTYFYIAFNDDFNLKIHWDNFVAVHYYPNFY